MLARRLRDPVFIDLDMEVILIQENITPMKTTATNSSKDLMIFMALCASSIVTVFALIQNIKQVFISATRETNLYCFFELF